MPELSVLVVTCNRPGRLRRVLLDLGRQSLARARFEVLVSDDGSEPPAEHVLSGEPELPRDVRWIAGPRRGPAAARNRALGLARAPLVLFLNDDVQLAPDLLEAHLARQASCPRPTAILGTFDFTPEILRQPLNRLIEEMGVFGTSHLPRGRPLGPLAFCTGNLSVPLDEVLAVGGFDEAYSEPACEDVDLGYRLATSRGVELFYDERARAWHDHPHDFAAWWRRWQMWGRGMRRLAEKHRDPLFWPGGAASLEPDGARLVRARTLAQEPLATELVRWLERLSSEPPPEGEAHIEALGRTFRLPGEAELLMRAAINVAVYFIHRAFWEAGR